MKKVLSIICAAALMVACGGNKTITINGDFSAFDRVEANSPVELRISGAEESLVATTLDDNKSFTAEINIPAEEFVMVYINDTPTFELITCG